VPLLPEQYRTPWRAPWATKFAAFLEENGLAEAYAAETCCPFCKAH
jgi:hypothetical protein